jgi:hypothetical protein
LDSGGGHRLSLATRWIAFARRSCAKETIARSHNRRLALRSRSFTVSSLPASHVGRLQFFGDHARLADKAAFKVYLAPLRKINWVVYANEPFAGPRQVLRYRSHYTHRIAISNRRLLSADQNGITFNCKDYRIEGPARYKMMTLATDEFIRRFLIHVLPKGFHRIYGLLANGNRPGNIAHARQLLALPARRPKQPETPEAALEQPRAAASIPVLRQPHDHHRDFRVRLRAEVPPHAAGGNQDRHLMMPSPSIYTYSNARHSYRLSGGIAQARIAARHSIAVTRPILSCYPQIARSHRRMRPSFAASRSRRPLQSNLSKPEPCDKIPIAPAAPPRILPRFRALALFGRRLQQRADSVGIPASKNLHNARHADVRQKRKKPPDGGLSIQP